MNCTNKQQETAECEKRGCEGCFYNEQKLSMNITPITVMEVEKLLNWLTEHGEYMAQIGDLKMKYKGIVEDTINGKRQVFYLERKVKG